MEAMAWEVGRSGSADADRAVPRLDRRDRPGAGGRRLPQHRVRASRPAAAVQRSRVGPRAVQLRPPAPGGRGASANGRIRRASSTSPCGSPTTCATRSATAASSASVVIPRSSSGSSSSPGRPGRQRYLDQAARFVERRGRGTLGEIPFGQAYFQDDVPIRDATVFRGHAVRAMYLAAGAVDVAVETGDDELLAARDRPVGGDDRPAHVPHRRDGVDSTRARRSATTSCSRPTGRTRRPAPGSAR